MIIFPSNLDVLSQGPIVGLEQELQDVRHHMAEEEVGIVGISGMGGIGKTTLLRRLFQEFCREDSEYDAVILADAPRGVELDSGMAQWRIASAMKITLKSFESKESIAKRLYDALHGKRYLIMLDGVKQPIKMEEIGIPDPRSNGNGLKSSKIVLTSRLHRVCRAMNANRVVHIALLGEQAAWELFLMHSKGKAASQSEIMPISKDIVKKCSGLPLSVIAVSCAYAEGTTPLEWKNLLELLNSSVALQEDEVMEFTILESSFHGLSSDRLRACFLYCSALLEERRFVLLDDVIEYWMEQGIFGDGERAVTDSIRKEVHNLIQQLEDACLLLRHTRSAALGITMRPQVQRYALCKIKQQFLEKAGFRQTSIGASMFPYFNATFQALEDDELRNCLLYFSLFPRDWRNSIRREQVFRYWMAEGILGTLANEEQLSRKMEHIFSTLRDQELLHKGSEPATEVAISEDLHSFTVSRGQSYRFLAQAGCGLTVGPAAERWQGVERTSLMHNHLKSLEVPKSSAAGLKTIILKGNIRLKNISRDVFCSKSLRVLDLSYTGIMEIPDAIGGMASLAHLNLSFTKIKSLPKEVGDLVNLRYLGLEGTILLEHVPYQVFSKLKNLVDLNMYDSYGDWAADNQGLEEGSQASIKELEGLKNLTTIAITISNSAAYMWYLKSQRLVESMGRLVVKTCSCNDLEISSGFHFVWDLTICDCFDIEKLVIGRDGSDDYERYTFDLQVLRLVGLYKAHIIWKDVGLHQWFRDLYDLNISFCHELTDISWVWEITTIEQITLCSCKRLEHVIKDGASVTNFPALKMMRFRKLPSLSCICPYDPEFPALKLLKVLECPQLRKLPLGRLLQRAEAEGEEIELTITGKKDWWDSLEWMDKQGRPFFEKYFNAE